MHVYFYFFNESLIMIIQNKACAVMLTIMFEVDMLEYALYVLILHIPNFVFILVEVRWNNL